MQPTTTTRPASRRLFTFVLLLISLYTSAQTDSLAFGDKKRLPDGLMGKIYELPENTTKLPDFDTMKAVGTLFVKKIDVPRRDWRTGFPGVSRHEWFGIVYTGSFKVKKAGHYTFRLYSDDGAKLFIDKKLVIDNDGVHGPGSRLGEFDLDASRHSIRIEYFQGPQWEIALQLFATFDKETEEVFPGNNFTLSAPGQQTPLKNYLVYAAIGIVVLLILWLWIRRKRKVPTA